MLKTNLRISYYLKNETTNLRDSNKQNAINKLFIKIKILCMPIVLPEDKQSLDVYCLDKSAYQLQRIDFSYNILA